MCRFIQIEHVDAVRNLDEIMKNEFIDGYIIGANDLSGSINELGNALGENTTALVKEAIAKLKATVESGDVEAIKADTDALQKAFYPIAEKVYKEQAAQGGAPEGDPNGGAQGGDGTYYDTGFEDNSNNQ